MYFAGQVSILSATPVDKLWTSPAGIVRSWLPRWLLACWNGCRCISQSETSCRCEWFWHCQMLKETREKKSSFTRAALHMQSEYLVPLGFPTAWHTVRFCCILTRFYFLTLPSRMGFASRTCCSIQECWPLMAARNCRISLVLSVFPAPDSPLASNKTQIKICRFTVGCCYVITHWFTI